MRRVPRQNKFIFMAGTALILIGIMLAGWPLMLKIQANMEQRRLDREFNQHNPDIPSAESLYRGEEENEGDEEEWVREYLEEYVYDHFPPTRIIIPEIELEVNVVEVNDLDIYAVQSNYPPGYFADDSFYRSVYPGMEGNVIIAGHRLGPAGEFEHLNRLQEGDLIFLQTPDVNYEYEVEWVKIIEPTELSDVQPTNYHALTLQTCQREGNNYSRYRLIVRAELAAIWRWVEP